MQLRTCSVNCYVQTPSRAFAYDHRGQRCTAAPFRKPTVARGAPDDKRGLAKRVTDLDAILRAHKVGDDLALLRATG